jgi:hypothetical protein
MILALHRAGLPEDEVSLREALEKNTNGWTLIYMPKAASVRWKAKYRLLLGDNYFDASTVAEAYAQALLKLLPSEE